MISLAHSQTIAVLESSIIAAENDRVVDLAWPVVVVVIVLALVVPHSSPLRTLGRRWGVGRVKVSAFGSEVELTQESKAATERALDDALDDFRRGTQALYRQACHEHSVEPLFAVLWERIETEVKEHIVDQGSSDADVAQKMKTLRSTLYVDHALLRDHLLQLVDYQPSGGGAGRAFSARFGIIGTAWRREESAFAELSEDPPQKESALIDTYGFSRREAKAGRKSRSQETFAAIVVRSSGGYPILAVFVDADRHGVLSETLVDRLETIIHEDYGSLIQAVERVQRQVKEAVPQVRLPDDQHF